MKPVPVDRFIEVVRQIEEFLAAPARGLSTLACR
jgi:hypothetical protein